MGASSDKWLASLPEVAVGASALFIVIANLCFIAYRLWLPYPVSAWEAGIVNDAWRMVQGQIVYGATGEHATHMHGPLITVLLAGIFELTGPVLQAGRFANALCGLALVGGLAVLFGRGSWFTFAVALALLLAVNSRTANYFTETRPDLIGMFFATIALLVFLRGLETASDSRQLILAFAGSAVLALGVLFKQTAAAFAVVPALVVLAGGRPIRKQLPIAVVPPVVITATAMAIWWFLPEVWHFSVEVPAQYRIPPQRLARVTLELMTGVPLFVVAFLHWLLTDAPGNWRQPRVRWLLATLLCAGASGELAAAKAGGVGNSLIAVLFFMCAFCAWRAPALLALLRDPARPLLPRSIAGVMVGAVLFANAYPDASGLTATALKAGFGVAARSQIVAEARGLPGKLVSPDDPTIALMAKGYAGRSSAQEADVVGWNPDRAQPLVAEIDSADNVILMQPGLLPDGQSMVSGAAAAKLDWWHREEHLRELGFAKSHFSSVSSPVYELWQRAPR